jgi:beta-glucosidase
MNKNHRQDCENGDRESYDLSFGQNELISELARIQPRMVVITFGGNPYAMPWLQQVAALVHCWYLGSEAGTSLVNVLTGKVNPSGKLPVTFAKQYEDYPYVKYGAEAYPGVGKQVYYKEDLFVGYRGFEHDKKQPQFPFGYGLSYTTFAYGKPVVSGQTVSVAVKNTGSRAGKETVQLYIGREDCPEDRPLKELKAFEKIELQPGETKTVSFDITDSMLRFFSVEKGQWTVAHGRYRLYVGGSSAETKNAVSYVF